MQPFVIVSRHALERFNDRLRYEGQKPYTREEIYTFVRRAIRAKGLALHRRGDGYALHYRGAKMIVKPTESGWVVKTVWPIHRPRTGRMEFK